MNPSRLKFKPIISIAVIITLFFLYKGGFKSGIFYGDALGYYSYLPATFLYGNLTHIQDMVSDTSIDEGIRAGINSWRDSYSTNASGNVIVQYTYGIAAMNAPFFLLGHAASHLSDQPSNGFTWPYALSIKIAGLFYGLLGLLLLYKVLGNYYNRTSVVIALVSLTIGTNFLWFFVIQGGMAHVHAFSLYALIIYSSYKIYNDNRKGWIALCAFAVGLLTVIRPTDIISILIPLTLGMHCVKSRVEELRTRLFAIVKWGIIFFIIPIIPQVIYWNVMTGNFLFYSYDEQGFDWLSPHIPEGLFGADNGWLTYTPVMLIPLLGMWKKKWSGPLFYANVILIPAYIYIVYAWWCYYYINGFGSRPMIHMYPLLVFPLAGMIEFTNGAKRKALLVLITGLSLVNLNYTHKALKGTLFTDLSNHAFNFNTFFKNTINYMDLILRDTDIPQPELSEYLLVEKALIIDSILIGETSEYSPFTLKHELTAANLNYEYLVVSGEFYFPELVFDVYQHHMMVLTVERGGQSVFWKGVKLNNKVGKNTDGSDVKILECKTGEWGKVEFAVPIHNFESGDVVRAMVWNPDRKEMYVRNFELFVAKE